MDEFSKQLEQLSRNQLIYFAKELQRELVGKELHRDREPIAVIGASCRVAGNISTHEMLTALFSEGREVIAEVPVSRWDVHAYSKKTYAKWGSFIEGVEAFDASFFEISPKSAPMFDPNTRLMLELGWEALESSAIDPQDLQGRNVGVLIGVFLQDHVALFKKQSEGEWFSQGSYLSGVPGWLSYFFDWKGLSVAVETACSSSLVAMSLACNALRSGDVEMALCGGVLLNFLPDMHITFADLGVLSPDGRCKTFDATADGITWGEGAGMVVLKPLAKAVEDGNRVIGVIHETKIMQDGRSANVAAPNPNAQQRLIQETVKYISAEGKQLELVETHGTGTKLGDPIEVQAIQESLCQERSINGRLALRASKPNVGHTISTAGVLSILKQLGELEQEESGKILHLSEVNPYVAMEEGGYCFPNERFPWVGKDRYGGVSGFALTGTIAHAVIGSVVESELPLRVQAIAAESSHVVGLSTRSAWGLKELVVRYYRYLVSHPNIDLASLSRACLLGRRQFEVRLAVAGQTVLEVLREWEMWKGMEVADWESHVAEYEQHTLMDKMDKYVRGRDGAQAVKIEEAVPRRAWAINLPKYPFERKRYWIGEVAIEPLVLKEIWGEMANAGRALERAPVGGLDLEKIRRQESQCNLIGVSYVASAFKTLGVWTTFEDRYGVDGVMAKGRILPKYRQLTQRFLELLVRQGELKKTGDEFYEPGPCLLSPELLDGNAMMSDDSAAVRLMGYTGPYLADVLMGQRDARDLIFPGGSTERVDPLYSVTPEMEYAGNIVNGIVREITKRLSKQAGLRWFEAGAGTGGTTGLILPELPHDQLSYMFTDVSAFFIRRAQERWKGKDYMRYAMYDMEKHPEVQGFEVGGYDVVSATNAIHAVSDLRKAVGYMRKLLAPGGMMILVEITRPTLFFEVTFGLLVQELNDENLRGVYPFLDVFGWRKLLLEEGFEEVMAFSDAGEGISVLGQHVIIARADGKGDGATAFGESKKSVRDVKKVDCKQEMVELDTINLDHWAYEVEWELTNKVDENEKFDIKVGKWILFRDKGGIGDTIASLIKAKGGLAIMFKGGIDAFGPCTAVTEPNNQYQVADGGFVSDLEEILLAGEIRGIIHLMSLDSPEPEGDKYGWIDEGTNLGWCHVFGAMQALMKCSVKRPPLWVVTQRAQVIEKNDRINPMQTVVWGLMRALWLECGDAWGGLIDVEGTQNEMVDAIWRELVQGVSGYQVAYRRGKRFIGKLVQSSLKEMDHPAFSATKTYLIVGGLGRVGLEMAKWLCKEGVKKLALWGRSGVTEERQQEGLDWIKAMGGDILIDRVDVSQFEDVRVALHSMYSDAGGIGGVIYSAMTMGVQRLLISQEWKDHQAMIPAKVTGAWNMHRALRDQILDFFVVFSSMASVLTPMVGQAAYAAGNSFMDGLMRFRSAMGLTGVSVQWGIWEAFGQKRTSFQEADIELLTDAGLRVMPISMACNWFGRVIGSTHREIMVGLVDVRKWSVFHGKEDSPFLKDILSDRNRVSVEKKRTFGVSWTYEHVLAKIRGIVAELLGINENAVVDAALLMELGVDSLLAVELRNEVKKAFDLDMISSTVVFDYKTVKGIAEYLMRDIFPFAIKEVVNEKMGNRVVTYQMDRDEIRNFDSIGQFDPQAGKHKYNDFPILHTQAFLLDGCSQYNAECWTINMPTLESFNPIDHDVLLGALNTVCFHHEALRTYFFRNPQEDWRQALSLTPDVRINIMDISFLDESEQRDMIRQIILGLYRIPLNYRSRIQGTIVRRGKNLSELFVWTLSHLVGDGVTIGIVCEDLVQAYCDMLSHNKPILQDPSSSYYDYCCRLFEYIESNDVTEVEVANTVSRKRNGYSDLPIDSTGNDKETLFFQTKNVEMMETLNESIVNKVRRVANENGILESELIILLVLRALGRWAGKNSPIPVYIVKAGRESVLQGISLSRVCGSFQHYIPLYSKINIDGSVETQCEILAHELRNPDLLSERLYLIWKRLKKSLRESEFLRCYPEVVINVVNFKRVSIGPFSDRRELYVTDPSQLSTPRIRIGDAVKHFKIGTDLCVCDGEPNLFHASVRLYCRILQLESRYVLHIVGKEDFFYMETIKKFFDSTEFQFSTL